MSFLYRIHFKNHLICVKKDEISYLLCEDIDGDYRRALHHEYYQCYDKVLRESQTFENNTQKFVRSRNVS